MIDEKALPNNAEIMHQTDALPGIEQVITRLGLNETDKTMFSNSAPRGATGVITKNGQADMHRF